MNPWLWSLPDGVRADLFFAILPPPAVSPVIEDLGTRLRKAHRLTGSVIPRERLHNTLAAVHSPRYSLEQKIKRARRVGANLRQTSFAVRFEWTGSFRGRDHNHPFVLRGGDGLNGLRDFRQALCERMMLEGFEAPASYTPHVTLVWADRCVEEYPVAPLVWTVRDFVLVLSLRGLGLHIPCGHWSCGPPNKTISID